MWFLDDVPIAFCIAKMIMMRCKCYRHNGSTETLEHIVDYIFLSHTTERKRKQQWSRYLNYKDTIDIRVIAV